VVRVLRFFGYFRFIFRDLQTSSRASSRALSATISTRFATKIAKKAGVAGGSEAAGPFGAGLRWRPRYPGRPWGGQTDSVW